ncbi:MAG TPA: TonB family protein [Vicinamibacteria bacterium]|nr:TonB family protein [Vicinamibacteria bacterium]
MHRGTGRKKLKRRGQPLPPKRRKRPPVLIAKGASGFESLVPPDSSQDFFFSAWLERPEEAAEFLEHGGEDREPLTGNPRFGAGLSAALHVALLLFLFVEPNLDFLRSEEAVDPAMEPERSPLVMFFDEPQPEVVAVPVVPADPAEAEQQPAEPPQVADNRLLIPKALLPAPDRQQEFMNDLPFSEGNTDEFYTKEEVKEPGEEGVPEDPVEVEAQLTPESGQDETFADASAGEDNGNNGTEADRRIDASELSALLFGQPDLKERQRPRADVPPPTPQRSPDLGQGGENGRWTDIRRFLAGAQFHNPEGGLVANTGNTLYYNDMGANFVPWIARLLAEVRRNWFIPYSIAFQHGHVAVGITVDRGGNLLVLRVLVPSGTASFDNASVGAIRAANLLPLPSDYPDQTFDIILVFWYNERPYDLFG